MANLRVTVGVDLSWPQDAQLVLRLGDENAADLASSTPAGGVEVASTLVWPAGRKRPLIGDALRGEGLLGVAAGDFRLGEGLRGHGTRGANNVPPIVIDHPYDPSDVCASLPYGVSVRDAAGNESAVTEGTFQLADPPAGARGTSVASTGSPNEAELSWTASPDV